MTVLDKRRITRGWKFFSEKSSHSEVFHFFLCLSSDFRVGVTDQDVQTCFHVVVVTERNEGADQVVNNSVSDHLLLVISELKQTIPEIGISTDISGRLHFHGGSYSDHDVPVVGVFNDLVETAALHDLSEDFSNVLLDVVLLGLN